MRCPGKPAPPLASGADRALTPDFGVDPAAAIDSGVDRTPGPVPGLERPLSCPPGSEVLKTTTPSGESAPRPPSPVRAEHAPKDRAPLPDFGVDHAAAMGSAFERTAAAVPVRERAPTSVRGSEVSPRSVTGGQSAPRTRSPVRGEHAPNACVPLSGDPATKNPVSPCGDRARKTRESSSDFPAPGRDSTPTTTTTSVPVGGGNQVDLDRFSALPDDLILLVLVRIPFAEAVRTSVLARRWRSLWTHLRTLVFREDPTAQAGRFLDLVDGALAGHASESLDTLSIELISRTGTPASRIANWLKTAAGRAKRLFCLQIKHLAESRETHYADPIMVLDIPCFGLAKQVILCPLFAEVRLPIQTFSRLTRFVLIGARFTEAGLNPAFVVSECCPQLQVLEMSSLFGVSKLAINCNMLLDLRIGWIEDISVLEIMAPKLQSLQIVECTPALSGCSASIGAPNLKILDWRNECFCDNIADCELEVFRFAITNIDLVVFLLEKFSYIDCIDVVMYEIMSEDIVQKEIAEYKLPNYGHLKMSFEPSGPEFNVMMDVMEDQNDSMNGS